MGYDDYECVICAIHGCNTPHDNQMITTCLTCFIKINNLDTNRETGFMNRLTTNLKNHLCESECCCCKNYTLCFDTFMCESCRDATLKNL